MNLADPLVELRDVQVRMGRDTILSHINWVLRRGENWAVLGANGAGKTTFLRLVRGDIWPAPGTGERTYYVGGSPKAGPIGFKERTSLVSTELADRYKRMEWNVTGFDAVCSGFWGTVYVHQQPTPLQRERVGEILDLLGIDGLAQRGILGMSQGEVKKILIARALVNEPVLLILDEVCEALDQASRESVLEVIQRIAENGTQILCATHMSEDLVPAVNRVLKLDSGRIVNQGNKKSSPENTRPTPARITVPSPEMWNLHTAGREQGYLIQISDADVFLSGNRILSNLQWTLKSGENWAILGENGSGKTTFLRLLIGDIYPKHGGLACRFGNENPQSIWEIRRRMSLVSADLQAHHMVNQSGLNTVLSGFFGSIGLHDVPTKSQLETARQWITLLGLDSLADRDITTLSYGQLRMLLIARAMVTQPAILLLDEPLAGLDSTARENTAHLIASLPSFGTSIVYVTHRVDQLLHCVTHVAIMNRGAFIFTGSRQEWETTCRAGAGAQP